MELDWKGSSVCLFFCHIKMKSWRAISSIVDEARASMEKQKPQVTGNCCTCPWPDSNQGSGVSQQETPMTIRLSGQANLFKMTISKTRNVEL